MRALFGLGGTPNCATPHPCFSAPLQSTPTIVVYPPLVFWGETLQLRPPVRFSECVQVQGLRQHLVHTPVHPLCGNETGQLEAFRNSTKRGVFFGFHS